MADLNFETLAKAVAQANDIPLKMVLPLPMGYTNNQIRIDEFKEYLLKHIDDSGIIG